MNATSYSGWSAVLGSFFLVPVVLARYLHAVRVLAFSASLFVVRKADTDLCDAGERHQLGLRNEQTSDRLLRVVQSVDAASLH